MVTTIKSFTSEEKYGLTVNETTGEATDCRCKSFHFSGLKHTCKHCQEFDKEVQRAAMFLLLKQQIEGMAETSRCYREMATDSRFN